MTQRAISARPFTPVLKGGGSISSKKGSAAPKPPPSDGGGGGGALAAASSFATTVADSKLFNTYLHAAIVVFIAGFIDAVGTDRYHSPRHRMPFNTINEGA